jgi:hypothetical protein
MKLPLKFWFINIVAFCIVGVYSLMYFLHTEASPYHPFWQASPFQLVFMISAVFLFIEAQFMQKAITAKMIKEQGTQEEFKIVNNAMDNSDKMFLGRFRFRK